MDKLTTEEPSGFISQHKTNKSLQFSDSNVRKTKRYSLMHGYRQQAKTQNIEQRVVDSIDLNKNYMKRNKINIFDSKYLRCLQQGGFKDFQQTKKLNIPAYKQIQNVSYVRYQSQPKIQPLNLGNHYQKAQLQNQQLFKQDKNIKFMKFKITLKQRREQNNSQVNEKLKPITFKNSKHPKSFLTQIKTQMSNKYKSIPSKTQASNQQSIRILSQTQVKSKIILQKKHLSQSERVDYQQNSAKFKNSIRSKISKLNEFSNLNQSIQNYQKKRQLLEELQTLKNYQERYGEKYFQCLMRNQIQEIQKHHNFTYKIKHKLGKDAITKPNTKFIERLYTQRPEILFRKNIGTQFIKLKGRRLTQASEQ